jgi:hypothetical protein
VRQNPQQVFLLLSQAASALGRASSVTFELLSENFSTQLCTALRDKHFPTLNGTHFILNILLLSHFAQRKRTTERWSSVLHYSRTVAILTTEISLSLRMRVCYLDYHEAGLRCYLVIQI